MKVLIVDDEPLARERLSRMIANISGCQVVAEAGNGEQALVAAKEYEPHVVLMDVRMPGMDGIAAAHHLAETQPAPAVIFCTAYDDYAIEAFASEATGYLLKPVKQGDLEWAVARAQRVNLAQLENVQPIVQTDCRAHIATKTRRGVDLIPVSDVRLFQADQKYVTAYHIEGEALLDETLKELEEEFDGKFVRVHRNALVSIAHIKGLERNLDGQYFVRLEGLDIRPQVSRRHVSPLRKMLETL